MKNIVKSIVIMMAFVLSTTAAFGQQEIVKPSCYDYVSVTFSTNTGSVVPANTKIEMVIYFKTGGFAIADTHLGYEQDQQTPFTYSPMCMSYSPNNVSSMAFRVYYGGASGGYYSYTVLGYVNTYIISNWSVYKPLPHTTE